MAKQTSSGKPPISLAPVKAMSEPRQEAAKPAAPTAAAPQVETAPARPAPVAKPEAAKLTLVKPAAKRVPSKKTQIAKPAAAKPAMAPAELAGEPYAPTIWLEQGLAMTRAFGTIQAKLLDHACAELKANLDEMEALARTGSAADALALQAKAFRRGFAALNAHLEDLTATARRELPRL
jgi:hypothetical protein